MIDILLAWAAQRGCRVAWGSANPTPNLFLAAICGH
jgi:hypothetical protein